MSSCVFAYLTHDVRTADLQGGHAYVLVFKARRVMLCPFPGDRAGATRGAWWPGLGATSSDSFLEPGCASWPSPSPSVKVKLCGI